ncbi:MAG: GGDEF domain-containing protein [Candidatus Brocadiae bacterium]|nr:GGDEF domain-containing protein [Candidatus Brocadiia bacterium]
MSDGLAGSQALLSDKELENVDARLRRIFLGSFFLDVLIVLLLVALIPIWDQLPGVLRVAYPSVLLWSLAVTAYAFHSYVSMLRAMRDSYRQRGFIDEVTGVFNYRYLELRLAEEGERTRRHGGFTAVLYLDLDNFKQVNDRFGHPMGNLVLEQVAQTMLSQARTCDVFGRVGGDEFLVVLPQTDRREAYVLAERVRQAVENYRLDIGKDMVVDFLRVSVGIAAYPVNGETMDNVVTAADRAVYESKEQGGNKVSVAGQFISADPLGRGLVEEVRGQQSAQA